MKIIFVLAVLVVYCNAIPLATVDSENNSIIQIEILDGEQTLSLAQTLSISMSIWFSVVQDIQTILSDGDNLSSAKLEVYTGISLTLDYRYVALYLDIFVNHYKLDEPSREIPIDYKTANAILRGWMLFLIQSNKLLNELRALNKSEENQEKMLEEKKESIIEMTSEVRQLFREVIDPLVEYDVAGGILTQISKDISQVNKLELESYIEKLKDISATKTTETTEKPIATLKTEKAKFVEMWIELTNATLSLIQQLHRFNNVLDIQNHLKLCRFDVVIFGMATEELVRRVVVAVRLFVTDPLEQELLSDYIEQLQNIDAEQIKRKITAALGRISTVVASISDTITKINENDGVKEAQSQINAMRKISDSREIQFEFEYILGEVFTLLPQLKQADDEPIFNGKEIHKLSDGDFVRYTRSGELYSSNSIVLSTVPLLAENAYILFLALQKYVKHCFDIVDKKLPYRSPIDSHIKGLLKIKSKYFYTDFCYTRLLFEKLSSYRRMVSNKVYVNVIRNCAIFSGSAKLLTDELIERVERTSSPDQSNVTKFGNADDQIVPLYSNILDKLNNIVAALWKSMEIYGMSDLKHKLHACRTGLLANRASLDAHFLHGPSSEKDELLRTIYKVADIIEANMSQIIKLNSDNYHTKWCETKIYKMLATMLANELYVITTPIYLISQCWFEYTDADYLQIAAFIPSIENICGTVSIYTEPKKPLVKAFIALKANESYDEENDWFFHFEKVYDSISRIVPIMTDMISSVPEPSNITSIAYQRYTEYNEFAEKQKQMRYAI